MGLYSDESIGFEISDAWVERRTGTGDVDDGIVADCTDLVVAVVDIPREKVPLLRPRRSAIPFDASPTSADIPWSTVSTKLFPKNSSPGIRASLPPCGTNSAARQLDHLRSAVPTLPRFPKWLVLILDDAADVEVGCIERRKNVVGAWASTADRIGRVEVLAVVDRQREQLEIVDDRSSER